jgi:hypothetical protein
MLSFARRSILKEPAKEFAVAVGVLAVLLPLASAQRSVIPMRPPAPPVHVSPIYRAPVISQPVMRPPAIYSAPYRSATLPAARGIGPAIVRIPFRPIRPRPPLIFIYSPLLPFADPFWRFNSCWWTNCDQFWPWTYGSFIASPPGPINYVLQASESPIYVIGNENENEREETPQLYLQDGTILNVTDYWVADNQLHFTMIEETGAQPVEHAIPFEELDLQKSIDANTRRGFRFILRNEPFEQYVRDHPEGPPPLAVPPKQ